MELNNDEIKFNFIELIINQIKSLIFKNKIMKTKLTLFLATALTFSAMAQQNATFETSSATISKISGAVADDITRSNLLDFQDATVTAATATVTTQNVDFTASSTYANPEATGVNPTSTCAYWVANTVTPGWAQGLDFTFLSPVNAGTNQYLHIMMKKAAVEANGVLVTLWDVAGVQSGNLKYPNNGDVDRLAVTTSWADFVVTIPSTHVTFNKISIKFNTRVVNQASYVDEIYMDNSVTPRTNVATAMNELESRGYNVFARNGKIVLNANTQMNVKIYALSGQKLYDQKATDLQWKVPAKGVYIVRLNEKTQKIVVD